MDRPGQTRNVASVAEFAPSSRRGSEPVDAGIGTRTAGRLTSVHRVDGAASGSWGINDGLPGPETLCGGVGPDSPNGGGGADVFAYAGDAKNGLDTIKRFANCVVLIEIGGSVVFADLPITPAGSDKLIGWNANRIILQNLTDQIDVADFNFV